MAAVDFAERQVTLKIVYCGPPLSGKTSNLQALHACVDEEGRGRLMTLDTKDDRTLFFDLLPLFFRASGLSFRIKVYTVPGQPAHQATRRIVLTGADGVVFVADSAPARIEANREAWALTSQLVTSLGLERQPLLVQYNKRDLPDAMPLEQVDLFTGERAALRPACATAGHGVVDTFLQIVGQVWQRLDTEVDLRGRFGIDRATFLAALAAHLAGPATPVVW